MTADFFIVPVFKLIPYLEAVRAIGLRNIPCDILFTADTVSCIRRRFRQLIIFFRGCYFFNRHPDLIADSDKPHGFVINIMIYLSILTFGYIFLLRFNFDIIPRLSA